MSHVATKKVVIDCSSAPAKLNVLRDMIIAGMIKDHDAIHAFGEMGVVIEGLVKNYVDEHVND